MARKISRWMHSANLTDGTGQTTDIVLSPQSYYFLARPVYGTSGDDPVLGPWGLFRYEDWNALGNVSSDTPNISATPNGQFFLAVYNYPEENAADFGAFFLFKRNGKLGIGTRAVSLTADVRGVEIIEWPFS